MFSLLYTLYTDDGLAVLIIYYFLCIHSVVRVMNEVLQMTSIPCHICVKVNLTGSCVQTAGLWFTV